MALAAPCGLFTAEAHGAPTHTLARFGTGGRPPSFVTAAVTVEHIAVTMPGTLTGRLTERPPAVDITGALSCDRMAPPVWVTWTHLTTVGRPELTRTTCFTVSSIEARWTATHTGIHTELILQTGLLPLAQRFNALCPFLLPSSTAHQSRRVPGIVTNISPSRIQNGTQGQRTTQDSSQTSKEWLHLDKRQTWFLVPFSQI